MTHEQVTRLRRQIFSRWWPLDLYLSQVGRELSSHSFLANPAGQQVYLYLNQFAGQLACQWHQRPPAQIRVLDWGCGKGQSTYLLQQQGFNPVSADVAETEEVRPILERTGIPLIPLEHDYQLPFEDSEFDIVLSFGVLEHVPNDRESLKEIRRVLKPGGLFLCFNLPRATSWIMHLAHLMGNHYHDRLYSTRQTTAMLLEADLPPVALWNRQLLPKNRVAYPRPHVWERLDQWLVERTPLGWLATSLEFVATRP